MRKDNERYLSIHVPKTGGTSLRDFFAELYTPENCYIHMQETDSLVRADQFTSLKRPGLRILRKVLNKTEHGRDLYLLLVNTNNLARSVKSKVVPEPNITTTQIPESFSVIHGHFTVDRYEGVNNARLVTVVREPLQRTVSEYKYNKWLDSVGFRTPDWFDPKMDFLDFALHEGMQNYQTRFVGNNLERFEHIGMTDQLEGYVSYFDPAGKVKLTRVNKGSSSITPPEITRDIESLFVRANCADYEMFSRAVELVESRS